jgi:hypothetical protein
MIFVLSDHDFSCLNTVFPSSLFYILFLVLLEQIVDIENQWLLMDDRFPSGKDFPVTTYYLCVLFQVPFHPFDKQNLGLMGVLIFVYSLFFYPFSYKCLI